MIAKLKEHGWKWTLRTVGLAVLAISAVPSTPEKPSLMAVVAATLGFEYVFKKRRGGSDG